MSPQEEAEAALVRAFVQGAQFWEWQQTGATMWNEDRLTCEAEALRLSAQGTLGQSRIRHP